MSLLVGLPLGIFRLLGGLLLIVLRFGWPFLLGWIVARQVRRVRNKTDQQDAPGKRSRPKEPEFDGPVYTVDYEDVPEAPGCDAAPDGPAPFGYKTAWLAVRGGDPAAVAGALGRRGLTAAGWASGLCAAERAGTVFISPALDGWVLAVGSDCFAFAAERTRLDALTRQFPEVQFFATHRVSGGHFWARYRDGACLRAYGVVDGTVAWDEGALTPEEIALGFGAFPTAARPDAERWPDEEDVLDIAAAWGVDTRFEKKTYPPSAGWITT